MLVLRVISGDNELPALDFQKHYRMQAVYLMDPDRSFERRFNRNGWPFLMLVNEKGEVVYQCNNLVERDKTFMQQMQTMAKTSRPTDIQPIGAIPYRRVTLKNSGENEKPLREERFTSLACGTDGAVYTAYTSTENGNSNVCVQIHMPGRQPEVLPVAASECDEYDATVITDREGTAWVCWTSNHLGRTYNVYMNSLPRIRNNEPALPISQAKEDAMHGRMALDESNAIWITYYRWHLLNNISRDKEIYVRRCSGRTVSREIHVSPEDVSNYEDHTDPAIAMLGNQPIVCWSWDFHQPDGYTKDAECPTIFARLVNPDGAAARAFPISGKNVDMTPVFGNADDSLWCAWDSLGTSRKSLCVRQVAQTAASGQTLVIAKDMINVCSPCFAFDRDGKGILTWSQTPNGSAWSLWKAEYTAGKWGPPAEIVSVGNPRFGSCACDSKGRLWLAYSIQDEKGRQVVTREYGNGSDH